MSPVMMKTMLIVLVVVLWGGLVWGTPAGVSVENGSAAVAETYLLESVDGQERRAVEISADLVRNQPRGRERVIPVRYTVRLMEVGQLRPRGSAELEVEYVVPSVANLSVSEVVLLAPDDVLADGADFFVEVEIAHDDDPPSGVFSEDRTFSTVAGKIAHFSGVLEFGPSVTTLTGLGGVPVWNAGLWQWSLSGATGEMSTGFGYTQGAGPLGAVREKNGDLEVTFGSVDVAAGDPGLSWMGWSGTRGAVTCRPPTTASTRT